MTRTVPYLPRDLLPEASRALARSRAYLVLARAFDYPDREFVDCVRDGTLAAALDAAIAAVHPAAAPGPCAALSDAGSGDDDLAVEYTRLFDVGLGGPPCPLYGGWYSGARMAVMEECVRFYNHFGLTLAESPRELPDHLATQLEFLHYLAHQEAQAWNEGMDPGPFRRAARDFIERHPGKWVPLLRKRLEKHSAAPFFTALAQMLEAFLQCEAEQLRRETSAGKV